MPNKANRLKAFLTKLTNWEYWPFSVIYFPVFFYYGWLSLRARSFFFFTASNPSIEYGGMFGERKSDIFEMIPSQFTPMTHLIRKGDLARAKKIALKIGFPLIAKPDVGERGAWVNKIESEKDLENYVNECPVDFLLQELVNYPVELGVFYIKYPNKKGRVTSIVKKEFLKVRGDGKQSIVELLRANQRAVLTADLESDFIRNSGEEIPKSGEEVLIEPIGNHCRGTKFLDDGAEIDEELDEAMNSLAGQIQDFYFGRFDLRCKSIEDLRSLKNFKILELNGAGAEPGHIYQPGYSLFKAYKDILWHLRVLADISIENHKRGVPYWDFNKGYKKWRSHIKYNKLLTDS